MADIQHSAITDPHIHEPKGASTAAANTVYVATGSGSGTWKVIGVDDLDYDALVSDIETDINAGDISIEGRYWLTVQIADISTASSVIIPIIKDSTVVGGSVVLGGAIADVDASITFLNSAGASMGSAVTVPYTSSAKGDQYAFTATGNNEIVGPSWIEVATNGASTNTVPLYITIELSTVLNPT